LQTWRPWSLQLGPLWDELFPTEQVRIVQLLVEQVEITEDGLDIRFRTDGLAGLVREFGVDARAAA
jgi:site-specific DNA recombinase